MRKHSGYVRQIVEALAGTVLALIAMCAVAAAGVLLLDLDLNVVPALVGLAVGGSATVSGSLPTGRINAGLVGSVEAAPMSVMVCGAIVVALVFLRRPVGIAQLAVRAGTVIVAMVSGLAVLAAIGSGSLVLPGVPGTVRFTTDVGSVVLSGARWIVIVVLLALAVSGHLGRWVRPFAIAAVVPLVVVAALGLGVIVLAREQAGAAVLGGANLVSVITTTALGVDWSVDLDPVLAPLLPDTVLMRSSPVEGRGLLVALVLFAPAALLAALARPREVHSGGKSMARRAGIHAATVGAATSVALFVMTAVAGVSVDAGISAFGFTVAETNASLTGAGLSAAGLGLAYGAAAGLLTSVFGDLIRHISYPRAD